ncbi:WD40 repeat-like protein [Meredithblackwellia eburnea MCA 4105]
MASSSHSQPVPLTPQLISSFKPARIFKKHIEQSKSFTSLSFDDKGELLLTSAEDETMQLFNARTGKHQKQLYSKKYGVHLARFTHKSSAIIHASTKEDDGIRYLSLHDNNYLRYYKGHKKRVISLQMSPVDDTFLSGSTDDTVRLWDLRSSQAQGLLNVSGQPSVAFDPSGLVFAVMLNLRSTLLLYDIKNYDKLPFLEIEIPDPILQIRGFPPRIPLYTSLTFNADGSLLLIGTSSDVHYVVDAFEGTVVYRLETGNGGGISGLERSPDPPYEQPVAVVPGASGEELTWSPDGRFVISGSIDGKVHIWDVAPPDEASANPRPNPGPDSTLHPLKSIDAHVGGMSRAVAFNPRTAMMASAGKELCFWLPDPTDPAFPKDN